MNDLQAAERELNAAREALARDDYEGWPNPAQQRYERALNKRNALRREAACPTSAAGDVCPWCLS